MIIGDAMLGLMLLFACLLYSPLFCCYIAHLPLICLPCTLIACLVSVCDRTPEFILLFCFAYDGGSV